MDMDNSWDCLRKWGRGGTWIEEDKGEHLNLKKLKNKDLTVPICQSMALLMSNQAKGHLAFEV